jgi:hypothetical protein
MKSNKGIKRLKLIIKPDIDCVRGLFNPNLFYQLATADETKKNLIKQQEDINKKITVRDIMSAF